MPHEKKPSPKEGIFLFIFEER